jgi:hypothetical protein
MAGLLTLPFFDVGAGISPADGALLYFNVVGSETDKDTYTTSAGASGASHTNPVVANIKGVFPAIYLVGDYDWVLTDKNLVQINVGSVSELAVAVAATNKNNTGWEDQGTIDTTTNFVDIRKDYRLSELSTSISNAIRLNGNAHLNNLRFIPDANVSNAVRMSGENNVIEGFEFISDLGVTRFGQQILLQNAQRAMIKNNYFTGGTQQIIQDTGSFANSVRAFNNLAVDNTNDFINANNDTDAGVSYDLSIMGNVADMTNNNISYGAAESRFVSITSTYGARAINNSAINIKGDAAFHLENTQETQIAFNYMRNCERDILFSGLRNREQIQLATIVGGTVEIGDQIVSTTSGGSGTIQFYDGISQIAQVILIVGAFNKDDAYSITAKATTGVIRKPDPVQAHANSIGNIHHKTNLDTANAVNIGGNNYRLRNQFIGNIYSAQTAFGGGTTAFAASFGYESKLQGEAFRGWSNAIQGTDTEGLDISNSHFWNNVNNINFTAYRDSLITNNNFVDGDFTIGTAEGVTISYNKFRGGVVSVGGTINNKWIYNTVENECNISAVDTDDFKVWESANYTKQDLQHQIRFTDNLNSVDKLLATLEPKTANCACVVSWSHSFRSPTSGGRSYSEAGRAMITWNNSSVPTVTLDPNNFAAGTASAVIAVNVSGNDVEVIIDNLAPTFNILATTTVNITAEQVKVIPSVDLKK